MKRTAGILLGCWLAFAHTHAQSGTSASIELGIGVAGRGEEASVPVTFASVDSYPVGRISFEVAFPNQLVVFRSAVKGPAVESLEMIIKTELQARETEAVLRVDLSSESLIPQGEVVELQFEVSEEAHNNDEFSLKNLAQSVQTPQGERLGARGLDGAIVVVGDAVFGCFFYMH